MSTEAYVQALLRAASHEIAAFDSAIIPLSPHKADAKLLLDLARALQDVKPCLDNDPARYLLIALPDRDTGPDGQ